MELNRGTLGLCIAALIVALGIVAGDPFARPLNGIGGLVWIGSAVILLRRLRRDPRFLRTIFLSAALTTLLVLVTRPSDYLSATLGFALAGATVALVANPPRVSWAGTIPALWLPIHLLVAVVKAVERSIRDLPASVRTDPPPTSALVPFVMVLAAILGGIAIQSWRARDSTDRPVRQQRPSNV